VLSFLIADSGCGTGNFWWLPPVFKNKYTSWDLGHFVVPMEITFMDNGGNIFVLDEFIGQMN
jgi:hypothetical protein